MVLDNLLKVKNSLILDLLPLFGLFLIHFLIYAIDQILAREDLPNVEVCLDLGNVMLHYDLQIDDGLLVHL